MDLKRDDFPVTLQAYEVSGTTETFIAEQVVNTQAEADSFMARYAGKLIKIGNVRPLEFSKSGNVRPVESSRLSTAKRRSGFPAWAFILIILIILLAIAYATGWLQKFIDKVQ